MRKFMKNWFYIGLVVMAVALAGCAKAPYTGRNQMILMDSQQEMALGASSSKKLLQTEEVDTTSEKAQMVSRVGKRIAAAAAHPEYRWEFHTIKKDELNAFCLPGGKVFVYTGLFKAAQTEEQLAAVVGHEVAHALARHGAERYSTQVMLQVGQVGTAVAVGSQASPEVTQAVLAAYGVGASVGVMLPYSRTHEYEADRIGLILMAKAGYNPESAVILWENMAKQGGPKPPEFLSTHPADANRIKAIKSLLPEAMQYYRPAAK
ncbi:M48 family metallopeptidase [Oleidesulfovibrio sp.]|uniref:M48 family metallopeptidase n=1 Tax=Oleidesulfovibrio sp. TaxID=2909707 RepID=UPI003A8AC209